MTISQLQTMQFYRASLEALLAANDTMMRITRELEKQLATRAPAQQAVEQSPEEKQNTTSGEPIDSRRDLTVANYAQDSDDHLYDTIRDYVATDTLSPSRMEHTYVNTPQIQRHANPHPLPPISLSTTF